MNWLALGLAVCLSLSVSSVTAQQKKPRPVVLLTDIGADMDDQWTLAHLALSPEFDLRGVVTSHAFFMPKPAAEFTAKTAREVLSKMPMAKPPPVIPGSSIALKDRAKPYANAGVDFLLQQSKAFSSRQRLTVLVIGAATDAASALLIDPTLADRIEIIAMGFKQWPEGGDEWNIKNDILAWQVVLESKAPIIAGDWATTRRDLALTPEKARQIFAECGEPGQYLVSLLADWFTKHPDLVKEGFWPIWDQVTLAYLMGMTKQKTYPRPTMDDKMLFHHAADEPRLKPTIVWITSIDAPRLWNDFQTKLKRALKTPSRP